MLKNRILYQFKEFYFLFIMILVLAIYFGAIFYAVKKVLESYNYFRETSEVLEKEYIGLSTENNNSNMLLNYEFDKNNVIYKAFNLEVTKHEMDLSKKVLICCTGDYQSMALLSIAANVFDKNNIHVFTINHDSSHIMRDFIEDVCISNNFMFHCIDVYNLDTTEDDRDFRYERITEVCDDNDIQYVFEGHNMINYTNQLLNNVFDNNKTNYMNTHKPFLLLDNVSLLKLFSIYNIPIDESLTHLEYSKEDNQNVFNYIDEYVSNIYPDWRINLIEHYNNIINTDDITNYYKGKYGFLIHHDFNKISLIAFKKIINKLCDEYNFCKINNTDFEEFYMENENISFYMSDEIISKINSFTNYLKTVDLNNIISDLINKDNDSESSFENLEIPTENKQTDEINDTKEITEETSNENGDDDNNDTNDNDILYKEYILKVNLDKEDTEIKLVDRLGDKFREEYLDGTIYINVSTNDIFIYSLNSEFVHYE